MKNIKKTVILVVILSLIIIPNSVKALTIDEQINILLNKIEILQKRIENIENSKKIQVSIPTLKEGSISTSTVVTNTEVIFSTTTITNGIQSTITESKLRHCKKWSFYYEFEEKPLFCNLPK